MHGVEGFHLPGAADGADVHVTLAEIEFLEHCARETESQITGASDGDAFAFEVFNSFDVFSRQHHPRQADEWRGDELGVATGRNAGNGRIGGAIEKLNLVS